MSVLPKDRADEAPLNPALKGRIDTTYDTETRSPAPYDSASAKAGDGEGWPWIWLVVTLACVVLAVYFIL